jgi:hypothetical protein
MFEKKVKISKPKVSKYDKLTQWIFSMMYPLFIHIFFFSIDNCTRGFIIHNLLDEV